MPILGLYVPIWVLVILGLSALGWVLPVVVDGLMRLGGFVGLLAAALAVPIVWVVDRVLDHGPKPR